MFILGLDKASQTPVFMCKKLIRLLALKRLSSKEFVTSCDNESMVQEMIQSFCKEFKITNPNKYSFPYITDMYKAHKNYFRWITSAHNCAFSSDTDFNTNLRKALNDG